MATCSKVQQELVSQLVADQLKIVIDNETTSTGSFFLYKFEV